MTTTAPPVPALEVVARAGLTYRRLDYLVAERFVRPLPRAVVGPGRPRAYRDVDVAVGAVLGRLGEHGMGRRVWAPVADALYALEWPWSTAWLVCARGRVAVYDDPAALVAELGGPCLVVRLPPDLVA